MVVAGGRQRDGVTDSQPLRPCRDEGKEHLWRRAMRIFVEAVMLDGPDAMIAKRIRKDGLLDDVVKDLPLGRGAGLRQLRFDEDGELHAASLGFSGVVVVEASVSP